MPLSVGTGKLYRPAVVWLGQTLWVLALLSLCLHPLSDLLSTLEQPGPASVAVERPLSPVEATCGAVAHAAVVPSALAVEAPHPIYCVIPPPAVSVHPLYLSPFPLPPR